MKKLLIPISFCLLMITAATAQEKNVNNKQKKAHHKKEMLQNLNLTTEQQTKVKNIKQDFKEKTKTLKANDNMTLGDFKKEMKVLHQQKTVAIQATLSTEQKAKIEKIKIQNQAERKEKMAAHFEKLKTKLQLTTTQETSLKNKQQEINKQVVTIRKNSSLSGEEKQEQIKVLKESRKAYLKSILTSEQMQKLETGKKAKK